MKIKGWEYKSFVYKLVQQDNTLTYSGVLVNQVTTMSM